jgi:hypothetical protein
MSNRTILFCAVLALAAAACGGKSKPQQPVTDPVADRVPDDDAYGGDAYGGEGYDGYDEGDYEPPPPMPPGLSGTWVTACTAVGAEHHKLTLTATEDRWDLQMEMFGDAACAKRKSAIHMAGGFSFGEQSTTVTNAWDATFAVETRDLTADDKKQATAMGKACGLKNLKAKQATSFHDKGCPKLGFKAAAECAAEHNIVSQEGSQIRFGARGADLCTADARPTAIDTVYAFNYQWKPTGIPDCDAYITKLDGFVRTCQAVPVDQRNVMFESIRIGLEQMGAVAQSPEVAQQVAEACKQGNDSFASLMGQFGC